MPAASEGTPYDRPVRVERRAVDERESRAANGPDWDRYADEYQATHGSYLGDAGFLWGPEGLTEDEAGILGDVTGKDVLEVGAGAGQCSRWVRGHGGRGVGIDLSLRQLQHSRRIDAETGVAVPAVLGTATALPFGDDSFDIVFCSFGALQFVADIGDARHPAEVGEETASARQERGDQEARLVVLRPCRADLEHVRHRHQPAHQPQHRCIGLGRGRAPARRVDADRGALPATSARNVWPDQLPRAGPATRGRTCQPDLRAQTTERGGSSGRSSRTNS